MSKIWVIGIVIGVVVLVACGGVTSSMVTPTPTVQEEYVTRIEALTERLAETIVSFGEITTTQALGNSVFVDLMNESIDEIDTLSGELSLIQPAAGWEDFHESFAFGIQRLSDGGQLLKEALDFSTKGQPVEASARMSSALRVFREGSASVDLSALLWERKFESLEKGGK